MLARESRFEIRTRVFRGFDQAPQRPISENHPGGAFNRHRVPSGYHLAWAGLQRPSIQQGKPCQQMAPWTEEIAYSSEWAGVENQEIGRFALWGRCWSRVGVNVGTGVVGVKVGTGSPSERK
jgi:hypothetical protein